MCIRDRGKGADCSSWDYVFGDPLFQVFKMVVEMGVVHQCCLLYTSDAADERSSVDLGGRRIIKKKKKDKSYGAAYEK